MIWLFGEIWAWILVGFLLGVAVGWWIWFQKPEVVRTAEPAVVARLRAELDASAGALARSESDLAAAINSRKAMEARLAAAGQPVKQLFLAAPNGTADDLTLINGIGSRLAALLADIGIFHLDQIAGWTADDIAAVDAKLGAFKGRIVRDQWVEQAQALARGNAAADSDTE
jgi:predicted flap endonuclease-1-like 5' DNA nuclease